MLRSLSILRSKRCSYSFGMFSTSKEIFESAVLAIKSPGNAPNPPSNEMKLKMYGLFKIATEGKCDGKSRPGMLDIVGRAKYDAWLKLGDLKQEEAMDQYVSVVKEIFGGNLPSLTKNESENKSNASDNVAVNTKFSDNKSLKDVAFPRTSNSLSSHSFKTIEASCQNHIANVILNRPNRGNAFDMDMWHDFANVFKAINEDSSVRVAILSGSNHNFSTGMDLSVFAEMQKIMTKETCDGRKREGISRVIDFLQDSVSGPENCVVPVIAMINGHCIGGAVDVISACDMRYCTKDSSFCIKETDLAMVADIGTLQRLPKLISDQACRELTYTGRVFDGKEAERLGLVLQCFDSEEAMIAHVQQVAKMIAEKSPMAIRGIKKTVLYTRDHNTKDALHQINMHNSAYLLNSDLVTAITAALTKTSPRFDLD